MKDCLDETDTCPKCQTELEVVFSESWDKDTGSSVIAESYCPNCKEKLSTIKEKENDKSCS